MKLHVTDLDSYIWYHKIESMTAAELSKRLKHTEAPNELMLAGTALHSIFENHPPKKASCVNGFDFIERHGHIFRFLCDVSVTLPQIREIRASKAYHIDGTEVRLTGKCDGITGNKILDYKLTFKPNLDTYFESLQWRCYLDIFNADVFEYIIFHGKKKDNEITITDSYSIKMYRYPIMISDIETGIYNLLKFIRENCPEMLELYERVRK